MLPSAFRVVETAATSPAKSRAALLSQDRPPIQSGVGKLYVGSCESALQWAGQHVGYIVNCADKSYPWHPFCVRFWLNPGYQNAFRSVSWEDRMITAVKLVLAALMFGESALLHCRQGKHRSGAFCVLILALLRGTEIASALAFYWSRRPDLEARDWRKVENILVQKNYQRLLVMMRKEAWCDKALNNILNRTWSEQVQQRSGPEPKKMPKRMPKQPPQRSVFSQAEAATSAHAEAATSNKRLRTPSRSPRRERLRSPSRSPRRAPAASSSSSSSSWELIRVCSTCGRMPWWCKCNPDERARLLASFFPRSAFPTAARTARSIDAEDAEFFEKISRRAGVWEDAEGKVAEARGERERSRSPTPEPHDREAWPCPECANLNSKHILWCTVASCGARRPLMQEWRAGDYYCPDCGNHRFGSSRFCQWVHCHSNDWRCPLCGNKNFAARKECHTRWCRHQRDWNCPSCGELNWVVREVCLGCGHRK